MTKNLTDQLKGRAEAEIARYMKEQERIALEKLRAKKAAEDAQADHKPGKAPRRRPVAAKLPRP